MAHTAEPASDTDAKIKRVISLAEEKKFMEADKAVDEAQSALKKYRYSVLGDSKMVALADRAQARLALAAALLSERKAEAGKAAWPEARDAYHAAGLRCDKMDD